MKKCSVWPILLMGVLLAGMFPVFAQEQAVMPAPGKILEMTYPYDENTIYWPTAQPFRIEKVEWRVLEGGWWYASNNYSASEHGGTHVDAPIHFAAHGRTIGQIPVQEWIGPAAKIDVAAKCAVNRDYMLTVQDVTDWEKEHGRIADGAWVLMYTGLDANYYPDRLKVLGTGKNGKEAVAELNFPGFSPEVTRFLTTARNIRGIGLDTPSIDCGKSPDFQVHQILCGANKLGIENIANLDKLPATGAVLYPMPMLIREGTGSPARIFAVLP
jgi:kynurenine formamidase